MRYNKNENYVDMWNSDKKCMISTMYKNMNADLQCGYDPLGKSITDQKNMIDNYIKEYHAILDKFVFMTDEEANKFCYYDMIKRGVIE